MKTTRRHGWMARGVCIAAVLAAVCAAAGCDDDESPTAPTDPSLSGDYRLAILASTSCGNDLDAGSTQQFDATFVQEGTDVSVTLVHEQRFPTEGQLEGVLDRSTVALSGTITVTPAEGTDYEASGTLLGAVGTDLIQGLFEGTIRFGEVTCMARDHFARFQRN